MKRSVLLLVLFFIIASRAFPGPRLELSAEAVDFGKIPQKSWFFHKIAFRSVGDQTLVIDSINTYCDCIMIPLEQNSIAPGESLLVEIAFYSSAYAGHRRWQAHIHTNGEARRTYLMIRADIIVDVTKHRPIAVVPHTVVTSQYGDNIRRDFPIQIINKTNRNVPLRLIYTDEEYFNLDFPVFIPPDDTAFGKVILNEKGLASEFQKSVTFEYIDKNSEKHLYSIPIRRNIYRRD